jgi:hypothetical protein
MSRKRFFSLDNTRNRVYNTRERQKIAKLLFTGAAGRCPAPAKNLFFKKVLGTPKTFWEFFAWFVTVLFYRCASIVLVGPLPHLTDADSLLGCEDARHIAIYFSSFFEGGCGGKLFVHKKFPPA